LTVSLNAFKYNNLLSKPRHLPYHISVGKLSNFSVFTAEMVDETWQRNTVNSIINYWIYSV